MTGGPRNARAGPFQAAVFAYLRGALAVSVQMAACNCLHPLEERCARWLLMCHDRVGADEFTLTHEFLAVMPGVRRATVSVTAASFQAAGIISYRHGRVKILDRPALEDGACECYAVMRDAFKAVGP